ncbi:MAG: lipopolysaccharide biosynthesis protein [Olsenella sp.]|nr:lipopolysaccharide biosynthesis protein [Olsenella sp.]MCI1645862.1 lipopolysaccharide biosynthesis protein [Olsenella sp.]MCI1810760.1 lipopolysaccharide biosynthesis protein [Olsenella sp.]
MSYKLSLKYKTIESLIWKLFERGGNALIQLIVQIVMARLLAPEQFGALAIMLVFVNIGNVIVQSGLNTALVQVPDIGDDDSSTVFWLSFAISILLYAIVFVAAPDIAVFYQMDYLVSPLRGMALLLVINSYNSVQVALVQRSLEFRKIFNATIISVLCSGVLGIGSALAGTGLWALVIQQLSYQALNCIALSRQVRWHPTLTFKVDRARTLFGFGWKLLVSALLDQGYQSLSDLIVGKQFSPTSLGFVSQGKKYPQALGNMLDGSIQPVMLSAVSRVQNDKASVKRLVRRALKTSTFLIVPAMTLFGVAAEPLVRLLLGEQWLPCVPFLQIYCFVYALLPIHTTNLQALNGMGRSDLFLKLELIKKAYGICFILLGAFVLKDVYLLIGSYMITGIISTFVNAYPNKRVIGYSYGEQLRDIGPAFILSAIAGAITYLLVGLGLPDLVTVLLQVIVMCSIYLLLAKLFHVEELGYLVKTVREILFKRKGTKAE